MIHDDSMSELNKLLSAEMAEMELFYREFGEERPSSLTAQQSPIDHLPSSPRHVAPPGISLRSER